MRRTQSACTLTQGSPTRPSPDRGSERVGCSWLHGDVAEGACRDLRETEVSPTPQVGVHPVTHGCESSPEVNARVKSHG